MTVWIIQQTEQETDPEGLQRVLLLLLLSTGWRRKSSRLSAGFMALPVDWWPAVFHGWISEQYQGAWGPRGPWAGRASEWSLWFSYFWLESRRGQTFVPVTSFIYWSSPLKSWRNILGNVFTCCIADILFWSSLSMYRVKHWFII